jgi:hypothetical protein
LSDTNQHYLMKAIERVCEHSRLMHMRCSPSVGYGQSPGIRRHPGRVDDDRVRAFHPSAASPRLTSLFHQ